LFLFIGLRFGLEVCHQNRLLISCYYNLMITIPH
jgi:hypothetical protein